MSDLQRLLAQMHEHSGSLLVWISFELGAVEGMCRLAVDEYSAGNLEKARQTMTAACDREYKMFGECVLTGPLADVIGDNVAERLSRRTSS